MHHCLKLSAIAVAVTLFATANPAPQAVAQQVINLQPFSQTGKLVGGDARGLQFEVLGTRYIAAIDDPQFAKNPTVVELNAKAKASFVQPGMCVRFEAKLDPKGKRIVAPIEHLTIFTPIADTRFGVFPGDAAPLTPLVLEPAAANAAAPAAPELPVAPAKREEGAMYVVAQVTRARKGELHLQVPGGKLEGRMADDVKIDVNVTDKKVALGMLRAGDMVQVDGGQTAEGKLYATKVVATLERPLGEDFPSRGKRPAAGDKPEVAEGAIDPRGDFGAAATEAAAEAERAATPTRARILKVN